MSNLYNDKYAFNHQNKSRIKTPGNPRSLSHNNPSQKRQPTEAMKRMKVFDKADNQRDSFIRNNQSYDYEARNGTKGANRQNKTGYNQKRNRQNRDEYDNSFVYDLNLKTEQ